MKTVVIAIQARSTSERLPNKALRLLAGQPALQWVLDPCNYVSVYMKFDLIKAAAQVKTCLVVPKGDPIATIYQNQIPVLEGDEKDVLSRYVQAMNWSGAEYIVRVTGDCFRIKTHIVARHIKAALVKQKDYTTNIHYRTYPEGFDCEVLSKRLLEWIDKNAKDPYDREHVTTLIAKNKKFPFLDHDGKESICHVMNPENESRMSFKCSHCGENSETEYKTSIDTEEEFLKAEEEILKMKQLKNTARGHGVVYV